MSNYTKTTNFTAKDSLASGNPLKVIQGALFDTEYDAIATAIATKLDTPAAPSTLTRVVPQGRLTLETGVGVSASDQLAKTSIFYTPYTGDIVPIFDGAVWALFVFTEIPLALDATITDAGFHESGKNFDLFVFNDGGTLRLGTGPAWTNDTTRSATLTRLSGLLTNGAAITLRFGSATGNTVSVSTNRATYVGTMRASANGQCEDSMAKRFLWNTHNRVRRPMEVIETTNTWTYSTEAWRQMNGSTANQLAMVRGFNEDSARAYATGVNTTNQTAVQATKMGVGVDSTTVVSGLVCENVTTSTTVGVTSMGATYSGLPGQGYHFLAALEFGSGTATTTWQGDGGVPLEKRYGITGEVTA